MSTTDNKENNKEIKDRSASRKKKSLLPRPISCTLSSIRISTDLVGCSVEGFWNGSTK